MFEDGRDDNAGHGTPRTLAEMADVVCLADVEASAVDWLWTGRIPLGAITILDGDPGLGKSTLMADLAARVTTGRPMPGETQPVDVGAVILMCAEDDPATTIKPRLAAAEADSRLVHAFQGIRRGDDVEAATLSAEDIAVLEDLVVKHGVRLVVIDPLAAYLPAGVDAHKDPDIRRVMRALTAMAQRTGAAVVIVRHLRKAEGSALYRGAGSIGIIGAARAGLLVARDPKGGSDELFLAATKANLGRLAPTISWKLVDADGVGKVQWGDIAGGVTADELVALMPPSSDVERAAREIEKLLRAGAKPASEVEQQVMDALDCSQQTVRRAKVQLGVQSVQDRASQGTARRWLWTLPGSGGEAADAEADE